MPQRQRAHQQPRDLALPWSRQAGGQFARFLLLLLRLVEVRHGFQVYGFYIRSRHNQIADLMTRECKAIADKVAKDLGLTEIKDVLRKVRDRLDRGYDRRAMAWEGRQPEAQRQAALQWIPHRYRPRSRRYS